MGSRLRRAVVSAAACTLALSTASTVFGHGGSVRAFDVQVAPDDPDRIVVRSDVWGIMETRDGGSTWTWTCAEVHQGNSADYERQSLVVAPDGKVFVTASFDGVWVSQNADLCTFEAVPELADDKLVRDIELGNPDGSLMHVVTSTNSTDGYVTLLWVSTDNGASWQQVGDPIAPNAQGEGFGATSVKVAPSNPDRVYLSGKYAGHQATAVTLRSDDGGLSYAPTSFTSTLDVWTPRVAGVHPEHPDLLFVWADQLQTATTGPKPDELWVSADAGETYERIFESSADLPGFAFSPDGTTVWIAGADAGLLAASIGSDGTVGSFELVNPSPFYGLTWTDEGLLAGGNDFAAAGEQRFTLGLSVDGGVTFEPMFDVCDVTLAPCAEDTPAGSLCPDVYDDPIRGGFHQDFHLRGRCPELEPGGGASDAGPVGPVGPAGAADAGDAPTDPGETSKQGIDDGSSGCSCRVGRDAPAGQLSAYALLLGAAAALRRGRLRRRR